MKQLNITELTFICFCILKLKCQLVLIRRINLNWRHFLFESSSFNITIRVYLNDRLKSNPKHKRIRKALIKKTPWTRTERCTHYVCELTIKRRHSNFAMPIDLSEILELAENNTSLLLYMGTTFPKRWSGKKYFNQSNRCTYEQTLSFI